MIFFSVSTCSGQCGWRAGAGRFVQVMAAVLSAWAPISSSASSSISLSGCSPKGVSPHRKGSTSEAVPVLFLSWCPNSLPGNTVVNWPSTCLISARDLFCSIEIYPGEHVSLDLGVSWILSISCLAKEAGALLWCLITEIQLLRQLRYKRP